MGGSLIVSLHTERLSESGPELDRNETTHVPAAQRQKAPLTSPSSTGHFPNSYQRVSPTPLRTLENTNAALWSHVRDLAFGPSPGRPHPPTHVAPHPPNRQFALRSGVLLHASRRRQGFSYPGGRVGRCGAVVASARGPWANDDSWESEDGIFRLVSGSSQLRKRQAVNKKKNMAKARNVLASFLSHESTP